jgi:hypothetical protein
MAEPPGALAPGRLRLVHVALGAHPTSEGWEEGTRFPSFLSPGGYPRRPGALP